MSTNMLIQVENLRVGYNQKVALEIKNLDIQGNIIGLIGHNGAGKSTFIKAALKLLRPISGKIDIFKIGDNSREIFPDTDMAFCPESGSVFGDISVESYVRFWCRIKHNDPDFYKKDGAHYMNLLSITPLFKKLGRELSKGQKRRVQTAIGFLAYPSLFLFDEPFDGLDVQKTQELSDIITEHSSQVSFVISSHRMDVVERISDAVIVLTHGKVACYGSVDAVASELAGSTFLVEGVTPSIEILQNLKNEFPSAVVGKIGHQISITGTELDKSKLTEVLRHPHNLTITNTTPSLVDAMNFHLKNLPSGAF